MSVKRFVGALLVGGLVNFGCAEMALEDEGTFEQEVLGPPTNVAVTATNVDRVTVSWDPVPGAIKYYVYKSTSAGGTYTFENTARAPETTLGVGHLATNTNYCFEVRTEDGTGPGAFSAPACTSTQVVPAAPAQSLATTSATTATTVKVQWSAVTGATKYYLYQQTGGAGAFNYLSTVAAPTLAFDRTGLVAGTKYCFQIKGETPQGMTAASVAACNTDRQPPTTVTAIRTTSTRIKIDWTTSPTALKYYVHQRVGNGPFVFKATVLASALPTYTASGLTTGTQYCYSLQTQYSPDSATTRSKLSLPVACATP